MAKLISELLINFLYKSNCFGFAGAMFSLLRIKNLADANKKIADNPYDKEKPQLEGKSNWLRSRLKLEFCVGQRVSWKRIG